MFNKKIFFFTIIFSFLLLLPGFIFAQNKPKITIFPLENKEKDLQIDVISRNVQRTVELNLKMLDQYIVEDNNITEYTGTPDWLSSYCSSNNIDNIIFGKADVSKTGSVVLQMSVFNRASKTISLTKTENAETLFDIFKASDLLAIGMIEGFSGMQLGFGELKFTNTGEKGKYSVYIDKVLAGEDISALPTIMTGKKNIKITQERMFGSYVVYNEKTIIEEKKITEVVFSIPGFLSTESKVIQKEEKIINNNWDDKYSIKIIEKSFKKLFENLTVEGYSESEAAKRAETKEKYLAWEKQKEGWTGRITILDKPVGISFFSGGGWMENKYKNDLQQAQDYNHGGFSFKIGVALSVNMPYNLAVQTGFEYSGWWDANFRDDWVNNPYGSGYSQANSIDADLVDIPLFLMYRLPGKFISVFGGLVFQLRVGGRDYAYDENGHEDPGMPIGDIGWSFATGIKGEIPLGRSLFMEMGIRYTYGITDKWIDADGQSLSINTFHILLGFGWKLGKPESSNWREGN